MELYLSMGAWAAIERDICPLETLEETLREGLRTTEGLYRICRLAAILGNAALRRDGQPETETAERVLERMIHAQDVLQTVQDISAAVAAGLRIEELRSGPVDVTLAELDRRDGKRRVTWRGVTGQGLIAGISVSEQETLQPGLIIQMYRQRQRYDDEQHGIRRRAQAES